MSKPRVFKRDGKWFASFPGVWIQWYSDTWEEAIDLVREWWRRRAEHAA